MQEKKEIAIVEHYHQLILRRRWVLIVPLFIATVVGLLYAAKVPRIYEARTLILVEPQRVPGEYVKSIIPHDMASRIATISQQIMSRSNLEKVIEQFKLFTQPGQQNLFMEDKLEDLRRRIKVQVTRSHGAGDAFSVSYQDNNPEMTMKIANALSSIFIEANLQIREEQAEGTSLFLETELETMRVRLEQVESELREFRQRNMGELPEQMDANLRILESLQRQLEERKERLRDEKVRLSAAEKDVDQLKLDLEKDRQAIASMLGRGRDQAANQPQTLEKLYDELATLLSTYTEMHPDVIRLRKKIEDMEKVKQKKVVTVTADQEPAAIAEGERSDSIYYKALQEKIKQQIAAQQAIVKLQQDVVRIENELKQYQLRIERTPKREGELTALKRDYENIQNTYRSLLNRKLEADIAVNLEKKKKGEQFRILDYAKMPEKPISPDMKKVFFASMAAGIGVGFAILLLFDFFDASVQRKEDLIAAGIPVLVTIPKIYNERTKKWRRLNSIASLCLLTATGAIACGFALIAFGSGIP
jgi:polysaccharide chain length determinant protein (PEP-CTERM system associated)